MNNTLHNSNDFEGMRKAGNLAASTLDLLVEHVKPGVSTDELDYFAFEFITKNGGLIAPYFIRAFQSLFVHQLIMSFVMEFHLLEY